MERRIPKVKRTVYTVVVKRMLDCVLSGVAIIFVSPLLFVLSIFEILFQGRPVLFKQERIGLHNEVFNVYKFRSMTNEKDERGNLLPGEKRLTAYGRFIRRYSLDELPQLFCVFTGKMSIIGPRPLLVKYLPLYSDRHIMRHEIRPGLACLPLEPTSTWTWYDQFENDVWYIENCSFGVDCRMIIAMVREAVRGSEYRTDDTRAEFNGKNLTADANDGYSKVRNNEQLQ